MTLLDSPTLTTAAQRRAAANFTANCAALAATQPELARGLLPPREPVEFVFARDGSLTALDAQGNWWSGCSLPEVAGAAMLKSMDVNAPVSCFLAPPHAAQLKLALAKLTPEQAVIAVVPDDADLRMLLACADLSADITAHRLWFAAQATWASALETLLTQRIGLAVPGQFIRLHASDDGLIQKLIQQATEVFTRMTNERAQRIGQLSQRPTLAQAPAPAPDRRLCVMAPRRFGMWNDEGRVLAEVAPPGSLLLNTSDPALASPLNLATVACECGALLTPNLARADLHGVIPLDLPWITWLTNDRIPNVNLAGPRDCLLLAVAPMRATAIAAGWPPERVRVAQWPGRMLPPAKTKACLTVIADTVPLATPDDLENFSSHRVLWETIRQELAGDPFNLQGDPAAYLSSRMRRFDVSSDSFPHERFVNRLIVPAYQQAVVKTLLDAGLPLRIYGQGWESTPAFDTCVVDAVRSEEEMQAALEAAGALVDLWPWRQGHPIHAAGRPVLQRDGRNLSTFVQRARNLLAGQQPVAPSSSAMISAEMLAGIFRLSV